MWDDDSILLSIKIAYTLFVCVLVPVYWRYHGPANFLWFSDIALFLTLAALWLEHPLLVSMQLLSVGVLELIWTIDFIARGLFRLDLTSITKYMFDPTLPLFVRGLSLFHIWLTPLMVWLVFRWGYDRRAWLMQTALAWFVLLVCFALTPPRRNVNWVHGLWGRVQTRLRPAVYLILLMLAFALLVYLPVHLLLLWTMPSA